MGSLKCKYYWKSIKPSKGVWRTLPADNSRLVDATSEKLVIIYSMSSAKLPCMDIPFIRSRISL